MVYHGGCFCYNNCYTNFIGGFEMSTRCQIEFKHINEYFGKKKPRINRRTIYRHNDGYPEGVIPDLKEFLLWNGGKNSDIEYQTANFIYWSKRWYEENYFRPKGNNESGGIYADDKREKWSNVGSTNVSILHTGFGVCENEEFHGDIEYFYQVVRETIEKKKGEFKTKTYILVYKIEQKDYSKPVTRKNLKKIKTIQIK